MSASSTRLALIRSKLAVGSSARMICGRLTIARAIATRCCSPPESACGWCNALSSRPTFSSAAVARACASRCGAPATISGKVTLASTFRSFSRRTCCKIKPKLRRSKGKPAALICPISCPLTNTRPLLGRSIAAIIFNNVDLPAPDGPAKNTSSPRSTTKDTSRNAAPRPISEPGYFLDTC